MPPNARSSSSCFDHYFAVTLQISLLFSLAIGDITDVNCLKSIRESLEDPFNNLHSSWNFNNDTEGFICNFKGIDCWHPNENRVMNIRLNNMGLKGKFPRGLENCTNLTGLDLSSNDLFGPIPSDISTLLHYVTTLDLSSNHFSGEIPPSLANCSFLNILKLDHNRLAGTIPPEIGLCHRLKNFSIANNLLTGPLPSFLSANFSNASYANNPGLCGYPLEPCPERAPKFTESFLKGFIVGCAFSAVSVMTIFTSSPWPSMLELLNVLKNSRKKKMTQQKEENDRHVKK